MKTWIIKITSAVLLFGFVFTGCAEPRHYERDRDDRHHRDRDHHDDNDHHDNDHHDNDNR
jgi:ABC-type nickel/cobalt efflux system permease component RcnA